MAEANEGGAAFCFRRQASRRKWYVDIAHQRTDVVSDGAERIEVETVDGRRVVGEHPLHLAVVDAREAGTQGLEGEGHRALLVRIVAAPHDLVDADGMADLDLVRADERRADGHL